MAQVFNSHSGVDIHAVFGETIFGELQMIAYKIDREKAPVYTLGSASPRTIARGKRIIQGSLVFVSFDRDSLLSNMNSGSGRTNPYLNRQDAANLASGDKDAVAKGGSTSTSGDRFNGVNSLVENRAAQIADQLLPFDVTLVAANEYGAQSEMKIIGVELMSEGSGVSIDDLVIEKQHSFIARNVTPWTRLNP